MADVEKIKSVVAYLAAKTSPGKVKLFKLMYLADFTARAQHGRSITGEMYENFEMGPVPVSLWHNFAAITSECVTIQLVDTGALPEQQMRARQDYAPQLDAAERAVLDGIVQRFGKMSGTQLKEYTHQTIPYRASERGDVLKYGLAAYLDYKKPSRADLDAIIGEPGFVDEVREALKAAVYYS